MAPRTGSGFVDQVSDGDGYLSGLGESPGMGNVFVLPSFVNKST